MHPILFRIPLPQTELKLLWVFLAVAGIALVVAAWQLFAKKDKRAALTGLAVAGGVIALRFVVRSAMGGVDTWRMGPIPIYSYGVMLGLSLVVGWYLTLGLCERDGLPKETMANTYVVTAIAAVLGARILYILTNLDEFDSLAAIVNMRRGGLVAYGGFLGGLAGSLGYLLYVQKFPFSGFLAWADAAVPSLGSGLMITRIGCYLFGCDFGKPLCEVQGGQCAATWAPGWLQKLGSFPRWTDGTLEQGAGSPAWKEHVDHLGLSRAADHSLPVHPTQLYESLVGLGLLVLLLASRRHQKFRGQLVLLFWFAYGVARFLLEIIRADPERGWIPPSLAEHVLIPGSLAIFGVAYVLTFSKVIRSVVARRVTQVLAFAPAVALYFALKPDTFASSVTTQLSTSQFVGLTTGVGAALLFSVAYKAALAHPEVAMLIRLPKPAPAGGVAAGGATGAVDGEDEDDEEDEDDAEERAARRRRARIKAGIAAANAAQPKAKGKPASEASETKESGEDAGDAGAHGEEPGEG
jgi:phosphatidylglycerol:prolipoprotein diacylglycerol transferase